MTAGETPADAPADRSVAVREARPADADTVAAEPDFAMAADLTGGAP